MVMLQSFLWYELAITVNERLNALDRLLLPGAVVPFPWQEWSIFTNRRT